jgi:uncharacterized NAD(P)/FAD-binding protein YdhS
MTSSIAIIGGGISGTLTVLNFIKQSTKQLTILWFDAGNKFCRGLAYSTSVNEHLLNVRANNMSLFVDEPDHFVNWLKKYNPSYSPTDFVPRKIFGEYVQHVFNDLKKSNPLVTIQQIAREVISVDKSNNGFEIKTETIYHAHNLVLALGNFLPAHPHSASKQFITSENYFQNAFHDKIADQVKDKKIITIIGSGLTMIDLISSLSSFNYKEHIQIISPHAYIPQAHFEDPLPAIAPFLQETTNYNLIKLLGLVNKQLKQAAKDGFNSHSVIDAIRPYATNIWLQFSLKEKKQFLRHLRHKWGVARHRAPAQSLKKFNQLQVAGKLSILKGRIFEITEMPAGFEICYTDINQTRQKVSTELIINCTGPQSDYSQIESPLIRYLIKNALISPDPIHYGLNAAKNGRISSNLYTLGSPLKGVLWESTAVPEIRLQAKELANEIISN